MMDEVTSWIPVDEPRKVDFDDLFDDLNRPTGYLVDPARLTAIEDKLQGWNRQLARAATDEAFTLTAEPVVKQQKDTGERRALVLVRVNHPRIQAGAWSFIGKVGTADGTENTRIIVSAAPGREAEAAKVKPTDHRHCDHCQTVRGRTETYLLQHHDTGEVRQVGSSCLLPFIGFSVNSLLSWVGRDVDGELLEELGGERMLEGDRLYPVRQVLSAALAVTEGGRRYLSRARAAETGSAPTAATVKDALNLLRSPRMQLNDKDRTMQDEIVEGIAAHGTPEVVDSVLSFVDTLDATTSEWAEKVQALAEAPHGVLIDYVGLLASAVSGWRRAQDTEATRSENEPSAEGFVAPVGAKLADSPVLATVLRHVIVESQWGDKSLVIFRDGDRREIKWMTAAEVTVDPGDQVRLIGGTVKAHDQYRGTDQTVIIRAKYEVVARAEGSDEAEREAE